MITRIWHGWTRPENAAAYQALLLSEIFPGIEARMAEGYRGISLLRREVEGEVEFATIMWFDSMAAVKKFAGEDHEVAVVPPKAQKLLARFDQRSSHFDTIVPPGSI